MMLFLAAPAEAHHPGGGGNTGSGGAINTISADTLSEGLIAASVRYEFIRLGQLSDADLLAAASQRHARAFDPLDRRRLDFGRLWHHQRLHGCRSRRRRPALGYQRTRAKTC